MNLQKGTRKIENGTKTAIIEFVFEKHTIFVFQGKNSQYDIWVRYKKDSTKLRSPKHIHWVIDILIKLQSQKKLTLQFLRDIQVFWNNCKPLPDNGYATLKALIEDDYQNFITNGYNKLNKYGEYEADFLFVLMKLLSVQEKTNNAQAYMFGTILEELLKDDIDIFKVVSTAGFRGK